MYAQKGLINHLFDQIIDYFYNRLVELTVAPNTSTQSLTYSDSDYNRITIYKRYTTFKMSHCVVSGVPSTHIHLPSVIFTPIHDDVY